MNGAVAFNWRVGVDNAFGWLIDPRGARQLCEARLFWRDGILISLSSGDTVVADADGSLWWQRLEPATACAVVGIPAPAIDGVAEVARRTDPFHVERHRSARFRALVELAHTHALPCGYALYGLRQRPRHLLRCPSACDGSPEILAASVAERVARGQSDRDALRSELATDAGVHPADIAAVDELLAQTGWTVALELLDGRISHHTQLIQAAGRAARPPDNGQLELL